MKRTFTKHELFDAFINGKYLDFKDFDLLITSIEREDGSGKRFNVTGRSPQFADKQIRFIETVD